MTQLWLGTARVKAETDSGEATPCAVRKRIGPHAYNASRKGRRQIDKTQKWIGELGIDEFHLDPVPSPHRQVTPTCLKFYWTVRIYINYLNTLIVMIQVNISQYKFLQ